MTKGSYLQKCELYFNKYQSVLFTDLSVYEWEVVSYQDKNLAFSVFC